MKLNKAFYKIEIESIERCGHIEALLNLEIPQDYKDFRNEIGGISIINENGPFLVLDSLNLNKVIGGFSFFYTYKWLYDINNNMLKRKDIIDVKLINQKLIKIGICEEPIDVLIGHDILNYNKIYLYNNELDEIREYPNLELFINDYLVEYDEKYF